MPAEQEVSAPQRAAQTPADKTASPRRARQSSIRNLQTDDFVCVETSTPLAEVIERMKEDEGGCAFVCDDGRVVGLFTEHDVLTRVVGSEVDLNQPVHNFIARAADTLPPDAMIGEAVEVMCEKGYQNIAVINDGRIVGSVSVFDVISFLAESYPKETMNLPPVPAQVMDTREGG
jgi:CBS domain-containing protein